MIALLKFGISSIYYEYSTLSRGISINVAPKVGIFPEAEGRGKYSLPRVQYIINIPQGRVEYLFYYIRLSLYNCVKLLEH